MAEDLSAVDRELEALGREPADLGDLIARYAQGVGGDLPSVDAELDGLGEAVEVPFAPATVEQPLDEQGPESGEYTLGPAGSAPGDEVELEVSGEMTLPEEHSGSYELPSAPADDGASDDPASAMAHAMESQAPESPDTEQVHLDDFDEDIEHTQVASAPDVTQVIPTDTLVDEGEASAEMGLPSSDELSALSSEQTDIDMMFDELTSPGSAPPGPSGEAEPPQSAEVSSPAAGDKDTVEDEEDLSRFADNMSHPPPEGGYEDDEATAVFDAALFRELENDLGADGDAGGLHDEVTRNASSNPPPTETSAEAASAPPSTESSEDGWEEELSIADLEIEELDASDFDLAVTGAPPATRSSGPPGGKSVPPPPPAAAQADGQDVEVELSEDDGEGSPEGENPGLIGRMFGRKKKKS